MMGVDFGNWRAGPVTLLALSRLWMRPIILILVLVLVLVISRYIDNCIAESF